MSALRLSTLLANAQDHWNGLMRKAIVSFSGGMDSTTVLAEAVAKYGSSNVLAVGFRYGSKHNVYENKAAEKIAEHYHVKFILRDFTNLIQGFDSNLLISGGDIPEGHYEEKSMSQTVVPARNMIFISVLSGLAWSLGYQEIWLGLHAGDHAIYEDCRPAFFYSMNAAVVNGTGERVNLVAPYLYGNKTSIVERGLELGVPYQFTRTCYKDQPVACGKCGSCQERLESFTNNGIEDPIEYESREILSKQ